MWSGVSIGIMSCVLLLVISGLSFSRFLRSKSQVHVIGMFACFFVRGVPKKCRLLLVL